MIVWGGNGASSDLNTGARYDPVKDTWVALSTTNAPTGRHGHSAVWDGKNMVIWGGIRASRYLNTGARYDPALNTWSPLPTTNAPAGRTDHTAIVAESDMLIFGGRSGSNSTAVFYKDTFVESLSHLVYIYQHP
jgi:N-acetylneuraminic acid mutarotase